NFSASRFDSLDAFQELSNCNKRMGIWQVVLDQIRTVDKRRLVKKLGKIANPVQHEVLAVLMEMFAE
ncbi:MAG: type II toxin-antitoxin system PemK/MazF family toxin, partial [Anaerolineaceae bacterium]